MQIVHALMNGPMGFNELARAIGDADAAQRFSAQLDAYRARKPWHR
jgi:DNA-binding HxlR family transcriptional regulator